MSDLFRRLCCIDEGAHCLLSERPSARSIAHARSVAEAHEELGLPESDFLKDVWLSERSWLISAKCQRCGEQMEPDEWSVARGAWSSVRFPIHRRCQGLQRDAVTGAQEVDASCNDCRHFQRAAGGATPAGSFHGHCAYLDAPVEAIPNHPMLMPCFVHRRTGHIPAWL